MKKISCNFMKFVLVFAMVCSIHVEAAEIPLVTKGYTEDGSNYEIHREQVQPDATTMPVTRYVTYQGNVTPPKQLSWEETTNGIQYSGTLTRISYVYMRKDNITVATYRGVLNYCLTQ